MQRLNPRVPTRQSSKPSRRCGLCGSTIKKLTRTRCCGNWICDDAADYALFSYTRNSCYRNHDRYTLCSSHYHERHPGKWQDCEKCRKRSNTELYVWYGTNEYNFEKLENPPAFEPTHCDTCGRVIRLGAEGYTRHPNGNYSCEQCGEKQLRQIMKEERAARKKK